MSHSKDFFAASIATTTAATVAADVVVTNSAATNYTVTSVGYLFVFERGGFKVQHSKSTTPSTATHLQQPC